jgi:hypothetical protein
VIVGSENAYNNVDSFMNFRISSSARLKAVQIPT